MRNLIRVEFRKMRCYWMTWGVGLFFIAHSVYMALRDSYASSRSQYPYIVTRIVSTGEVNTRMPMAEFLAVFFVMALQPLAYAAVTAMVSVFCKSQSVSVVAAEAWLFFSIVLRLYSIKEVPGKTAAVVYRGPIAYEPLTVLERFLEDFVLPGRVFTFDFFMCAISAVLIIAVSSAIGYMHLQRSDVR